MWGPVVEAFAERPGLRMTCPTLAGHGPSPSGMKGDFEDVVDALHGSFLAEGPAVVVGYSLGGRLALGMAARYANVRALLVGTHAGLREDAERAQRRRWEAEQIDRLRTCGVAEFFETWERLPIFASQSDLQRSEQRAWRNAHTVAGLVWAMHTLGLGRMPTYGAVPGVRWLTGERDGKFTALAAHLGGVHRVARGVGHNVVLEAPEVVVDELCSLLADVP